MSGQPTLNQSAQYKATIYDNEENRLPNAHTCFKSIDLFSFDRTQEEFNQQIDTALNEGMGIGFMGGRRLVFRIQYNNPFDYV